MITRTIAAVRGNLVAWLALFVAMGGTGMAASHYVVNSTKQINPKVIKKLKGSRGTRGATGSPGPVGPMGPKGATGTPSTANFFTKTESDGRFLGKGAKAADSATLNGLPGSSYLHGAGHMVSERLELSVGSSAQLLELDFGHIEASCNPGAIPVLSFVAELTVQNVVYWATNFGAASDIQTANALTAGNFLEATHTASSPQSVTWQASYDDGSTQLATAWTTGQDEGGSCVFTGQGFTTL